MYCPTAHVAKDFSTQFWSLSNVRESLFDTGCKITTQARALPFIPVEGFVEFESRLQSQNRGQTHWCALANA